MMLRKFRIFAFILFLALPLVVSSQSKPKRDTSKDNSAIIARQQEQAKQKAAAQAAEKKKKEIAANQKKRAKVVKKVSPKSASFLVVNNSSTSLTKKYGAQGGSERFPVQTDGENWTISFLPTWCQVTKGSDYFILSCLGNDSHDERSDWFSIKSDSKEVRVLVQQAGAPINVVAQVEHVNLSHNFTGSTGASGSYLKIKADVTIQGAKGVPCLVVATFFDQYGPIKAAPGFGSYAMNSTKDLYVYTQVNPQTDAKQNFKIDMLLPNDAMQLYKRRNKGMICKVSVYCVKTSSYVSPFISKFFNAKLRRKKIRTS